MRQSVRGGEMYGRGGEVEREVARAKTFYDDTRQEVVPASAASLASQLLQ